MSRLFLSQFYIARLLIQVCKDGRAETDGGYISSNSKSRFRVLDFRLVAGGVRDCAANMYLHALSVNISRL